MKKHLIIYAALIAVFLAYNFFFRLPDSRANTAVNILLGSILFLYIAYMAWVVLKKIGNKK